MSQQRTLVLSHTAQQGGAELALVRVVEELRERGHDAHVVLFAHGSLEMDLAAASIPTTVCTADARLTEASRAEALGPRQLLSRLGSLLRFIGRLRSTIAASGADLVVANTLKSAVLAAFAAPAAGRAWVWHLHDRLTPDYLPRPLRMLMALIALWGPRVIVVNSRATLATLPRRAQGKAVVVYPGLTDRSFVDHAPESPRVVGIVGRVSPTKGQREFIEAARSVAVSHPDVRFRVVGTALFGELDYEAELLRSVDEGELHGLVDFTGWVSDVPAQISRLSVLVHASPVPEPFGQVITEAFAASVPVIAAASGGAVEIMDASGESRLGADGLRRTDVGVLVRPGDAAALARAITDVLDDPDGARARATTARAVARDRFGIEKTADAVASAWSRARRQRQAETARRRREIAN